MKQLCMCALAGGLLLAAAGCQNTVNRVENADRSMTQNVINDKRFVTDGFLADRLLLTGVNTSETSDGLLRVQLTAVNARVGFFSQMWSGMTGENPYKIQYKFTWFDGNGMAVDSILSTWKELTVIPGEQIQIQSIAPSRDCRDFSVNLKEAE
ncbi:MAG: YcfL family protein [Lentisphaeria bacterium]|nr:YcfL family protein [Lentisphaeria bacterium]